MTEQNTTCTTDTYNRIKDVFSKDEVKIAVEHLHTFKERLSLLDRIISRRQEIEFQDNLSKIHKYAHIFKRMLHKHKSTKASTLEEQQKMKMEMVMNLLRKNRKSPTKPECQSKLVQSTVGIRRGAAGSKPPIKPIQRTIKLSVPYQSGTHNKLIRFYTEREPEYVEQQVGNEIYDFLQKDQQLNQHQKEGFLSIKNGQSVRRIESKVRHHLRLQESLDFLQRNKVMYSVSNAFSPGLPKLVNQQRLRAKQPTTTRTTVCSPRARDADQESFVSYTEIKLTQLYSQSNQVQKSLVQSGSTQLHKQLIYTSRDIIDLSNKKLFPTKL